LTPAGRRLLAEADLLRRALRDPRVPRRHKLLLGAALAYLAMPFDLIPDFIPGLGQLDDAVVLALAVRTLRRAAVRLDQAPAPIGGPPPPP
jgi:uncharacterized membrane protein YkvA (DUF1232 family)